MKKLLGIIVLTFFWTTTSFASVITMECARHYILFVDIDRGTVTQDIFFLKKKGSKELKKKPNRTVFPIEEYSRDTIITGYANYKHGWVKQAQKMIIDLKNKTITGHGYKDSIESMNKYPDKWERYNDPSLNIRYDFNYKCPGLKTLNVSTNNNSGEDDSSNLSLEAIKETCRSFGYKEGTEKFADCSKDLFLKNN